MAEEEKKIECACIPDEVKKAIPEEPADMPCERCCEAEPEGAAAPAEAPETGACAEPGELLRYDTKTQMDKLMQKVDAIGEVVESNRGALDCLLDKMLCSHGEGESGGNVSEIIPKLASIESSAAKHSQVVEDIKAEALALHRLYQNDFAGRIRTMETELERYRKRDAGLAFDGIYKEIAQVYVDFEDLGDGVEDKKLAKNIRYLLEEMEELLLSHGVEMMKSGEGEKRNLAFTQVIDRVPTEDPALDGLVKESLSSGFYIEKRCLIKERVNVYRYEAPAQTEEPAEKPVPENLPDPAEAAADNE